MRYFSKCSQLPLMLPDLVLSMCLFIQCIGPIYFAKQHFRRATLCYSTTFPTPARWGEHHPAAGGSSGPGNLSPHGPRCGPCQGLDLQHGPKAGPSAGTHRAIQGHPFKVNMLLQIRAQRSPRGLLILFFPKTDFATFIIHVSWY